MEANNEGRPTVVHAINNLDIGGVEAMCLDTIRQFEKWGNNHLLVIDGRRQPRRGDFEALDIPITDLQHRPGEHAQLVWKAYRFFRSVDADGMICWSFGNHAFLGWGGRLAGVTRNLVSLQNAPPSIPTRLWKCRGLGWVSLPVTRCLVACSSYVESEIASKFRIPSQKLTTVYNGCDVREIHRTATAAPHSEVDGPVIGMVARLNEIKDQATLIRAMPVVLTEYPGAELWLVGEGNRRRALEELARDLELADHVRFFGNRDDVPRLLGQMDVFAFATTKAEGFGIALIEALAAEVPVVATDVGPCAEVLNKGKWGRLVPEKSPDHFAKEIMAAHREGENRQPSVEEVYARYDRTNTAKRYWEILLGRRPPELATMPSEMDESQSP